VIKPVLLTIFTNLSLQISNTLFGLIITPLMIERFGSSVNGMVASISQFIAYITIVEAGIGAAAIANLYQPLISQNHVERNRILSASRILYFHSGYVYALLLVILIFLYPVIIKGEILFCDAALMVFILGYTGIFDFFVFSKYKVLLTADRKIYIITISQLFSVILQMFLSIWLIKLNQSIITVKFVCSVVLILRNILMLKYVKTKYCDLAFNCNPNFDSIRQSKNVLVHQISGLIVFNLPLVLITIFCSLVDASIYSVYAMIFYAIFNVLNSFSNGLHSFFGTMLVLDNSHKLKVLFMKYEMIVFFLIACIYSCSYLLINPFIEIYTKSFSDTGYLNYKLSLVFIISGLITSIRIPSSLLIVAAGHYKKTQYRSIFEASVNLVLSLIFVIKFGMLGVFVGIIIAALYRTIDMIIYSAKYILKISCKYSFIKLLIIICIYLFLIKIIQFVDIKIENYKQWFITGLFLLIVFLVPLVIWLILSALMQKTQKFHAPMII